MKPWLILLNDFAHDLFTGLWFGGFLTMLVLRQRAGDPALDSGQLALMNELVDVFFWVTLASLGCIILTGLFRFFYYRTWDGSGMKDIKKRLLIIKHAVLGTSFLIGTGFVIAWGL
jgi:putative copper export protein